MTISEALAPVTLDSFVREYLGKRYALIRGVSGRFAALVSWPQLNEALSRMRVGDERVFLTKRPNGVPRESYVHTSPRGTAQYLDGPALNKHIRAGATLVLTQVDELFPEVRRLAESCEDLFQIHVSANLYAGWRTDNAFDVHWDTHDTLIVQVIGRKNWKVWAPTRLHPLPDEPLETAPSPLDEPVWQGTLEEGDTLYMPRGWWHVAFPRDEPSLHVTFGAKRPTGIDLLNWAVQQMRESIDVRMDVPHLKSGEERAAWLRSIRDSFTTLLTDDLFERYVRDLAERAHARPIVRLPEHATDTPAVDASTPLRLSRGRRLYLDRRDGAGGLAFRAQGLEWHCPESLAPALALLSHVEPCTLAEMSRAIDDRAKLLLSPFIMALVMADVLWAEPASSAG